MKWLGAAIAFLLLASIPFSVGQEPDGSMRELLQDASDDAVLVAADQASPVQPWPMADLRSLSWEETVDALNVQVQVAALSMDRPQALIVDDVELEAWFSHGAIDYIIRYYMNDLAGDRYYSATLYQNDPTSDFPSRIQQLELEVDGAAATLTAMVPRSVILNEDGAQLGLDDTITNIWVESESLATYLGGALVEAYTLGNVEANQVQVKDRMPDAGIDEAATWDVQFGVQQFGHLALSSERPFRLSNGEATTFLYEILLHNAADHRDTVTLDHSAPPNGWVITFPEREIRIDAGEDLVLPVLVTVPFHHQHGTAFTVQVTGQSRADPQALARIELGVRYTAIPQPAGHHDQLYVHLGPEGAYMNTVDDHDGATGEPDGSTGFSGSGTSFSEWWDIPLAPGLGIGLDFDLDRLGLLNMPIAVDGGAVEVHAGGGIYLRQPDSTAFFGYKEVMLARLSSTDPVMATPGQVVEFEHTIEALPEGDFVPYVAGSSLILEYRVTSEGGTPSWSIQPGGQLQLPLNEYHDDVDQYFAALSGIDLVADGEQHRLVNPGETVLFTVEATNTGTETATYDLELSGSGTEWARVLGPAQVRLQPGASQSIGVAVAAPNGAVDEELADLTFLATHAQDSSVRSLIRLLAEVDTDADHADEGVEAASIDEAARSTPIVAWPLLAATGFAMRRLRDQIV